MRRRYHDRSLRPASAMECRLEPPQVTLEKARVLDARATRCKPGVTPQLTGDRPACGHECLVIAPDHTRCHPAQKPLGLLREFVANFSDPDELVCDPYDGGGTTGTMCAL
jgi:DNA modification methylase